MCKYFSCYKDACQFVKNIGLNTKPAKKEIWIYPSWELVWTVKVD